MARKRKNENLQTEILDSEILDAEILKNQKIKNVKTKRKVAKIGMSASLGILSLTAFAMKKFYKLHTIAGIAMVAFSLYHANLYPKRKKSTKR